MNLMVGDTFSWERTFAEEDVVKFAEVSGDQGDHHMKRDADGRLMVHGLLTATLPTKLGGDVNYIAREMDMEFLRPVYSGDTIQCEMTVIKVESSEKYLKAAFESECINQHGKVVLKGYYNGLIRT
ncbi:MAG TPA: MaoC family dehydratase [Bacillales bacterium]|nr:MaoC family dehydratase [Bacillales bacterium]